MTRGALVFAAASLAWSVPALAAPAQSYEIAAQDLGAALDGFAAVSGREVIAPSGVIAGKRGNAVRGAMSPEEALTRLLAGTGLRFEIVDGAFVIKAAQSSSPESGERDAPPIIVTGTRIRGVAIASPRITLGAEELRNQGLATLTEAARTIPQNFGGGQNPTVGINVPATSGVNVGGGSSLNLRGLGSDATLTLLNGRRLAYSASRQSVDLSAIPTGIVQQIEIIADGASAIYGSDAVAGVANIILRRDMEGLVTTVRLGGSTDGGNDQQIYSATGGARWDGGGGVVAYEYGFNSPIVGAQRSYARTSGARGLDLIPELERHNAALTLHQALGPVTATVDALYNRRRSLTVYAANAAGDRGALRVEAPARTRSFLVSPALGLQLGDAWRAELSGSYGEDEVRYNANVFNGAAPLSTFQGCYCNNFKAAELAADGRAFELPAGAARTALGVGFRDVGFVSLRGTNTAQNIAAHQRSAYAFGEANLPLLARRDGAALLHAIAAVRYERYPDLDDVVTPKAGLVVSPTADFDLKASWGRSFRAPTLLQRYETNFVQLNRATSLGGSGLPAGSNVLVLTGGRPDLKPERARSWSVTADIHPRALEGMRLELSFFDTRYIDRIVTPITFTSQALSNPIYADRITRDPGVDSVLRTIAGAGQFFNLVAGPLDPTRVAAIIDNASVNAATQHIYGIDGAFTLQRPLGTGGGRLNAAIFASYLRSNQRLTAIQPQMPRAGQLFNPPHFRARGVLGWSGGLLGITAAVDRTGGVVDPRPAVPINVRGMTTFDLTVRLRSLETEGPAKGLDIVLTAQNLFNAKPARIANTLLYDNPYDSTNYSPVGRFIAISVSKAW